MEALQDGSGVIKGALRFGGSDVSRPASLWARLPSQPEPGLLQRTLQSFALVQPGALISVVGGEHDGELRGLSAHARAELARGLASAARTTRAMVLAGDAHASSSAARLVGEALREAGDVLCVGVADWRTVEHAEDLAHAAHLGVYAYPAGGGTALANAAADDDGYCDGDDVYDDEDGATKPLSIDDGVGGDGGGSWRRRRLARPLEPSFSHFLLCDGGEPLAATDGCVAQLRRAVENVVAPPLQWRAATRSGPMRAHDSGGAVPSAADGVDADEGAPPLGAALGAGASWVGRSRGAREGDSCPMVLLVLGGGLAVLRAVIGALKDARPVVVVAQSGHAAEDIAEMCHGRLGRDELPPGLQRPRNGGRPRRSEAYRVAAPKLLHEIRRLHRLYGGGGGRGGGGGGGGGGGATAGDDARTPLRILPAGATDDPNALPHALCEALLSFFDTAAERARCVAGWRGGAPLRHALRSVASREPTALARGLERALRLRNADAVEAMLELHASPHLVRLDELLLDSSECRHAAARAAEASARLGGGSYPSLTLMAARGSAGPLEHAAAVRRRGELHISPARADGQPARCKGSAMGFAMLIAIVTPYEPTYAAELRARWHAALAAEARAHAAALSHPRRTGRGAGIEEARLAPAWLDLLLWAVIAGERRIALALWRRVEHPLRAAVLVSVLARALAPSAYGRGAVQLLDDAAAYEACAVCVLEAASMSEAHLLLLSTDTVYGDGQRSVLELAADHGPISCRALLAHPAAVETLRQVFEGFKAP